MIQFYASLIHNTPLYIFVTIYSSYFFCIINNAFGFCFFKFMLTPVIRVLWPGLGIRCSLDHSPIAKESKQGVTIIKHMLFERIRTWAFLFAQSQVVVGAQVTSSG